MFIDTQDFTVKTVTGAAGITRKKKLFYIYYCMFWLSVTVLSSVLMAILFAIEFRDFLSIQVKEELFVDTTRIPNMKINFDITFPRISCSCKYSTYEPDTFYFKGKTLTQWLF